MLKKFHVSVVHRIGV